MKLADLHAIDSKLRGFWMKHLVKKFLSVFGVGIHRLPQNENGAQPRKMVITSPLAHNSKDALNAFYADQETAESNLDIGFYERLIDFFCDRGIVYDGKQVADLGCGMGHLLKFLTDKHRPKSVNGFEYSEAALQSARSRLPSARMDYLDIYEPPSSKYDVLFCVEVLEHLLHPQKALRNIVSMIAPSGSALLTVPNGRIDTFEGHINFWSPESWDVFVRETCEGFEVTTGLLEEDRHNFAIVKSIEK